MKINVNENFNGKENREIIRKRWNGNSDTYFNKRNTASIINQIRKCPSIVFHKDVFTDIKKIFQEKNIKKVGILGSGDNQAAIAFHFLGVDVTSIDISERQIDNARNISESYGINIKYIVSDILDLSCIANNEFDMIYTSNGVLTWIDNLSQMFSETRRILKKKGIYILYDVHPFQRPWKEDFSNTILEKPYTEVGPIKNKRNGNAQTFHWRIEDIINALVNAKFLIKWIHEFDSGNTKDTGYFWGNDIKKELNDWRKNPLAGIPSWIEIVSEKDV